MKRKALVLGGTGTVGSAVLHRLKREAVSVVFNYFRSEEKARNLESELGFQSVQADLGNPEAIAELLKNLERHDQLPDLIIHCAGINRNRNTEQSSLKDWKTVMNINCRSGFLLAKDLAPHLRVQERADIVFVGALDRNQSLPLPTPFAASQGALGALTMALAKELGSDNIRVNMVVSGILNAGLSEKLGEKNKADYKRFSAMQRLGRPEEVAATVLFLASDESSFTTGQCFDVSGGRATY